MCHNLYHPDRLDELRLMSCSVLVKYTRNMENAVFFRARGLKRGAVDRSRREKSNGTRLDAARPIESQQISKKGNLCEKYRLAISGQEPPLVQ